MTALHVRHGALDDASRGAFVFDGDLVVFGQVAGMTDFRDRVDALIRECLGTDDPQRAQFAYAHDEYADRMRAAQQAVRADAESRRLLLTALEHAGLDPRTAYWDWVHLRILPAGPAFAKSGTGWHRDTWASGLPAQTNWWAPIYPITAGRTITFAPEHWATPVPNSSADWTPGSAQVIPEPLQRLHPAEQRVVLDPGDLLCFSGAQLHGTVPNDTGLARFSIEVRTVTRGDVDAGRGAPVVDDTAPRTQYRWFRHVFDDTPLTAPAA